MAIKNKNLPNPSGTASTMATMNVLGAMVGVGSYAKTGPALPLFYTATAPVLAHFLTDKKSLDLAINFAENATPTNAVKFSQRMKAITGYTPVTLLREAQKLEQENQEENGNDLGQRFNRHIEENKAKPKAPAFNKTIEDMYNNKYIKNFIGAD